MGRPCGCRLCRCEIVLDEPDGLTEDGILEVLAEHGGTEIPEHKVCVEQGGTVDEVTYEVGIDQNGGGSSGDGAYTEVRIDFTKTEDDVDLNIVVGWFPHDPVTNWIDRPSAEGYTWSHARVGCSVRSAAPNADVAEHIDHEYDYPGPGNSAEKRQYRQAHIFLHLTADGLTESASVSLSHPHTRNDCWATVGHSYIFRPRHGNAGGIGDGTGIVYKLQGPDEPIWPQFAGEAADDGTYQLGQGLSIRAGDDVAAGEYTARFHIADLWATRTRTPIGWPHAYLSTDSVFNLTFPSTGGEVVMPMTHKTVADIGVGMQWTTNHPASPACSNSNGVGLTHFCRDTDGDDADYPMTFMGTAEYAGENEEWKLEAILLVGANSGGGEHGRGLVFYNDGFSGPGNVSAGGPGWRLYVSVIGDMRVPGEDETEWRTVSTSGTAVWGLDFWKWYTGLAAKRLFDEDGPDAFTQPFETIGKWWNEDGVHRLRVSADDDISGIFFVPLVGETDPIVEQFFDLVLKLQSQ